MFAKVALKGEKLIRYIITANSLDIINGGKENLQMCIP